MNRLAIVGGKPVLRCLGCQPITKKLITNLNNNNNILRTLCTGSTITTTPESSTTSATTTTTTTKSRKDEINSRTFTNLLRHSPFMQLGDIQNRLVRGRVVLTTDDDLYIDFGGKFNCVCRRPRQSGNQYHVGTEVIIKLKEFELSSRFLGSDTDLTLLEADAILVGRAEDVAATVTTNDRATTPKPQIRAKFDE